MLDVNPNTRSTANQVLNSPWIIVRFAADFVSFWNSFVHKLSYSLALVNFDSRKCVNLLLRVVTLQQMTQSQIYDFLVFVL